MFRFFSLYSKDDAAITIVNNGSYDKIADLLSHYKKKNWYLISHNVNIGRCANWCSKRCKGKIDYTHRLRHFIC
jgi:hypothetical protein